VTFAENWQAWATQLILVVAALTALVTLIKYARLIWGEVKEFRAEQRQKREEEQENRKLLQELKAEFKPNGGGSMKDAINRVEEGLGTANRNIATVSQRQLQMYNLDYTGIWETDASGFCNYVNPAMARLADASPDEFRGTGWKNLVHPADRAELAAAWASAVAEKRDFNFAYRFRNNVAVRVSGRRMFAPTGEIVGWIGDCHKQRTGEQ
jgi:PAS domain S-box-containing protein